MDFKVTFTVTKFRKGILYAILTRFVFRNYFYSFVLKIFTFSEKNLEKEDHKTKDLVKENRLEEELKKENLEKEDHEKEDHETDDHETEDLVKDDHVKEELEKEDVEKEDLVEEAGNDYSEVNTVFVKSHEFIY